MIRPDFKKQLAVFLLSALAVPTLAAMFSPDYLAILEELCFCAPFYHPLTRGAGLLVLILLQYAHADTILYFLSGIGYLTVRYGNKQRILSVLQRQLLVENGLFVLFLLLGSLFAAAVSPQVTIALGLPELLLVLIRAFGLFSLVSLLQLGLLLRFDIGKTFGILTCLGFGLTFFSGLLYGRIPAHAVAGILWILFYGIAYFCASAVLRKIFMKEWGQYAN